MSRITVIFLALALGWLLQLILSGFQTKRFHQAVIRLRRPGCKTAVGFAGSNLKGKEYVVIVVDDSRTIIDAQRLKGVTVMASLKPASELVGIALDDLDGDPPPNVRAKSWEATRNAAGYIQRALEQRDDGPRPSDVPAGDRERSE